jgi:hypothetical protein
MASVMWISIDLQRPFFDEKKGESEDSCDYDGLYPKRPKSEENGKALK